MGTQNSSPNPSSTSGPATAGGVTPWTSALAEARFSHFDDSWLEREYSPSSAIGGNYQPYVTSYAERSAAVREALVATSMLGVRYGRRLRNIIDIFPAPTTDGSPAPALIFFHGGYWQESSLRDVSFPAAALNAAGMTYISVEYTLVPKATLSEIVEEARQAVRFVVENAGRFAVDPARLVLGGHSAGAQLAVLAAREASKRYATKQEDADTQNASAQDASAQVATTQDTTPALLLISGIYELLPLLRTSINDALALNLNDVDQLSPMRSLPGGPMPAKASIVWGDNDTKEFAWQSQTLHRILSETNPSGAFEENVVPQRNHFDVIFDLADRTSELFGVLLHLVGK